MADKNTKEKNTSQDEPEFVAKPQPRHLLRMKAFQFLYGQAFLEAKNGEELEEAYCAFPAQDVSEIEHATCEGFAWQLVAGVWGNAKQIDTIIEQYAKNWRLDRVGRVELGLLRIAIYEMLYCDDTPSKVAINEALELNREFGEAKSKAFLNGILDAVAKAIESGQLKK